MYFSKLTFLSSSLSFARINKFPSQSFLKGFLYFKNEKLSHGKMNIPRDTLKLFSAISINVQYFNLNCLFLLVFKSPQVG